VHRDLFGEQLAVGRVLTAAFAVVGYVLVKLGFETPPLLLGFVLAS